MEKIKWMEELSIGNTYLDECHKDLIELVNEMIEFANENDDVDMVVLSDVLNRLIEYAIIHHREEEAYLQQIGCPDLPSHKAHHRSFLERISYCCHDTIRKKENLYDELCEYLVNWITFHIFAEDRESVSCQKATV